MYAKSSVDCCKNLKFLTSGFRDNCPQKVNFWSDLTSLTFCSEGIFRAIMFTSQIGDRPSQEVKLKTGPKLTFSKPNISPKWGPIPPFKKHFSQSPQWVKLKSRPKFKILIPFFSGPQGYNVHESDRGSGHPKWSKCKVDQSTQC